MPTASKRLAGPASKGPGWSSMEQAGMTGLMALRREAVDQKKPFDYERPIELREQLARLEKGFGSLAGALQDGAPTGALAEAWPTEC